MRLKYFFFIFKTEYLILLTKIKGKDTYLLTKIKASHKDGQDGELFFTFSDAGLNMLFYLKKR